MKERYKELIKNFYTNNRRMPSYSEIMKLVGVKSKETVFNIVNKLVDEGFVEKDARGRLVPKKLQDEIKVLGVVEAGFPTPAEEELLDTMTLDDFLIHNRESTFMLKVSGESMIEAGITPGDMVLVERNRSPQDGDIVIANVDHSWTMKYYKKQGEKIFLMPANKKFHNIYPKDELQIAAVVSAVIRKYH